MPLSTAEAFGMRQQSRRQERMIEAQKKRNKSIARAQERVAHTIETQPDVYMRQLSGAINGLPLWPRVRVAWDIIRRRFGITGDGADA